MKLLLTTFFLVNFFMGFSQVKGTVVDDNGNSLPAVSVFLENSFKGTTTNDAGKYELNISAPGNYTLIFQYLGYKTQKIAIEITQLPYVLDVTLQSENIALQEVVINPKNNPANDIVRNAIAARKLNTARMKAYKADFYSRGIFRIKNAPTNILGVKFDQFDEILDSTRSGILYLSETVSKLVFQKPDKLKETIMASKVSGNDNGYSFNNAATVDFDFYENTIPLATSVISPIASNAFNYYRYKMAGVFYDENNREINKIRVIPVRKNEPVFDGFLYIVSDSWALYGVDLTVLGANIQAPAINVLTIKQNFTYNKDHDVWARTTQTLDFIAGLLGINVNGRFTYVYSNFEFEEAFPKKTFGAEVLVFEKDANKKQDDFWTTNRPVPLTEEETLDYDKKGKLQEKKESKVYLDSIDKERNKFLLKNIVTGYTYSNSYQKSAIQYAGFLRGVNFNTVQGYALQTNLTAVKRDKENRTYTVLGTTINYGFSEDRLRSTGFISRKFNNTNDLELGFIGGSKMEQFNSANPISELINTIATGFFRTNYMKIYDRSFMAINFKQEVVNGILLNISAEYNWRKPLLNNTDESFLRNGIAYTSNNPLDPLNFTSVPFYRHQLAKTAVSARFSFGQQYWTRPDGKFNLGNSKYPVLFAIFEKGFAANEKRYHFQHLAARISYDIGLSNKGVLAINAKAGKFFNADQIAFADYKHFNGNQTQVGQADRYLNVFNLMPYYAFSTNKQYGEIHTEYNDNGYIINKIPLLNKLKATLIFGAHVAIQPDIKPYSEYSVGLDNLGIGKFKFLRLDYVRAYQNGLLLDEGIIFGLKFLNLFN